MKIKFTLLFCFVSFCVFAQGVDNLWLMGYAGPGAFSLNFAGGNLNISQDTTRKMEFEETNGVISDKNGNLLFSSNGVWIENNVNDTMLNGDGLNPSAFTTEWANIGFGLTITQANLIIPFSSDSSKYYLFHQTDDDFGNTYCSFYLYYSVIDMSLDSGRGVVIDKNHVLLQDSLIAGGLTACKHANGRDWWLIAYQYRTDTLQFGSSSKLYYKFLITPSGVLAPDTQSIGSNNAAIAGQAVFSPDGKYFANYLSTGVDVFNFDRCTGLFSPKTFIALDSTYSWGVAFSPNSQVLYLSQYNHVFQFDMNAADIPSSTTTILSWDGTYSPDTPLATLFYLQQIAPDGKIYINCPSNCNVLHVINNPNVIGLGCNACQHCVLLPSNDNFTIANHPNYFLGAEVGSVCDSLTSLIPTLSKGEGEIKVFPDPVVGDEVTFSYNVSPVAGVISIYDVEGRVVAEYNLPQWSSVQRLRLPEMPSGVYVARFLSGGYEGNVRFVKE